MNIGHKIKKINENLAAVNVPVENRIYLKEWQIDKIRKLGLKIHTGSKGGQFLDNRELKANNINLDKIFASQSKSQDELIFKKLEELDIDVAEIPDKEFFTNILKSSPNVDMINNFELKPQLIKDICKDRKSILEMINVEQKVFKYEDLILYKYIEELNKYFKNAGYDDETAICLAKGSSILRLLASNAYEEYVGYVEDYIQQISGNHRSKREKYDIDIFDADSFLAKYLLTECLDEFRLARQLSQNIFKNVHGNKTEVYRGIAELETLQIMNDLFEGNDDIKLDATLGCTTHTGVIALEFNKNKFTIDLDVNADKVISGWWFAIPKFKREDEIMIEYESGGQPIKDFSSQLKKFCSDRIWTIEIENWDDHTWLINELIKFFGIIDDTANGCKNYFNINENELQGVLNNIIKNINEKAQQLNIPDEFKDEEEYKKVNRYILSRIRNLGREFKLDKNNIKKLQNIFKEKFGR